MFERDRQFDTEARVSSFRAQEALHEVLLTGAGRIEDYDDYVCNVLLFEDKLYQISTHGSGEFPLTKLKIYDAHQVYTQDEIYAEVYTLQYMRRGRRSTAHHTEVKHTENLTNGQQELHLFAGDGEEPAYAYGSASAIKNSHEILEIAHKLQNVLDEGELIFRLPQVHPEILATLGDTLLQKAEDLLANPDYKYEDCRGAEFDNSLANVSLESFGAFSADNKQQVEEISFYIHPNSPLDLVAVDKGYVGDAQELTFNYRYQTCKTRTLRLEYDPDELEALHGDNGFVHRAESPSPQPATQADIVHFIRTFNLIDNPTH